MCSRSTFCKVLVMGYRSEMERYEVPRQRSLLGLGIDMILANFQICGMILELRAQFSRSVSY
jgi:hypothetical protein